MLAVIFRAAELAQETSEFLQASAEAGVYLVPRQQVNADEFLRCGFPAGRRDPRYHLYARRGLQPVFPKTQDVPDVGYLSYDVWYLPDQDGKTIHRLTATRLHGVGGTTTHAVMVDGNTLAANITQKGSTRVFLFDQPRYYSGAHATPSPHVWLTLGGQKVRYMHFVLFIATHSLSNIYAHPGNFTG